jgi:hypothetical protein
MSDALPFNAESIAAALAHAAVAQGDTASVTALAVSVPELTVIDYGEWVENHKDYIGYISLYLKVPPEAFGRLCHVREDVEKRIGDMFRPIINSHRMYQAAAVSIIPADEAPLDWRKQTLAWLRGEGVTNQGRVRSDNIAARQHDGLLFRSQEEINLYRALKSTGVSFAPLPVFIRGGKEYRRIEPDFVLILGGMVAVIEVDGNHQESPVEAHNRTAMLVLEGAHVERVRASDCSTLEGAEVCAKRVLASLAKVRASR